MALIIKSNFQVDVPRQTAWDVITDIERSAPCFPGAELGEREADGTYKGAFNVKLGPLSFRFAGKFGFVEMHPENGTARISASGTDTKGRGGAQAMVDVTMTEVDGKTDVQIVSDLVLSGSVAQYGRGTGMIQALSQQLINQFARNLSSVMTDVRGAAPDANANADAGKTAGTSGTAAAADMQANTDAGAGIGKAPKPNLGANPPPAAALDAGSLIGLTLKAWIKNVFKKLWPGRGA